MNREDPNWNSVGGRGITNYDPERHPRMVRDYIAHCNDSWQKLGKESKRVKLDVNLPTVEGFGLWAKIPRRTIYDWRDRHEEFREALDELKSEQHQRLLNSSLANKYNPVIAKLILQTHHGYKDVVENKNIQQAKDPTPEELAAAEAYENAKKRTIKN